MPNWVRHKITIRGSKESLDKILSEICELDEQNNNVPLGISFNKLRPMPKELNSSDPLVSDGDNWYSWRVRNWGTKWDASEAAVDRSRSDVAVLYFDTAWATPEPILNDVIRICRENGAKLAGEYSDEDYGNNCGKISMGGVRYARDGSRKAAEIAKRIWGKDCFD